MKHLVLASLIAAPAFAHESATEAEQVEILKALQAEGCDAAGEDIVEHDGGFEVLEATCADGLYFVVLDGAFTVTKKIKQ